MAMTQRLTAFFNVQGGQAQAELGKVTGSILGVNQAARQAGQGASMMNQQWRALGTTMKYMVAGGITYGMINMVRQLAQFQQQMGLISAIGQQAGFKGLGTNLTGFSDTMMRVSTDTVTNVNDVADAFTNFFSTVQAGKGVTLDTAAASIEYITKAAKLSQTPVEDMTKAITTMNVEFGRANSTRNIQDFAARWFELISAVPGGISAAPQLVGQMPRIAAASRFAGITPGQMFALTSGVLRFGMPPSMTGQGLSFLLNTLANPSGQTKQTRAALASLGIDQSFIRDNPQGGTWNALLKIFNAVSAAGTSGNFRRASRLARANQDITDPNQISDLGISGKGIELAGSIFKRQHALRTFVALYSVFKMLDPQTGGSELLHDLNMLGDSVKDFKKQQADLAKAWQNFTAQSGLSQAAIALQNMKLQFSEGILGPLQFLTNPLKNVQGWMTRHKTAVDITSKATFGILTLLGVGRLAGGLFGGAIGRSRFGRRLFGLGSDALWRAKLGEDVTREMAGMPPDGSPEKPFYVVLLKSFDQGNQFGIPRGKGFLGQIEKGAETPGTANKAMQIFNRLGMGKYALPLIAGLGTAYGVQKFQDWLTGSVFGGNPSQLSRGKGILTLPHNLGFDPTGKLFGRRGFAPFRPDIGFYVSDASSLGNRAKNEAWAARQLGVPIQKIRQLERFAESQAVAKALADGNNKLLAQIENNGLGGLTLDLTVVQDGKKVSRAKVHLDPSQYAGGKTPGTRGRKKKMTVNVTPHQ